MITRPLHLLIMACCALLAAFTPTAPALADASDIAAAARGVVRVIIIGRDGDAIFAISHGTGFSVGGERIVTNAHVLEEALEDDRLAIGIVPPEGGDAVYARLLAVSPRNDLALLETTEAMALPPLTITGNTALTSGAVTAIGYPMNVDVAQGLRSSDIFRPVPPVTSTGFLSGQRPSREFDTLLHTAPIARGNSGGPLVDECGRVLGVNSFGTDSTGSEAEFFFAISTRELLPFLRANGVQPRLNTLPCRSMAELDAAEMQREQAQRASEQARTQAAEAALARRTEEWRRDLTLQVIDQRTNHLALALLLVIVAIGAAVLAVVAQLRGDRRLRALAGSVALAALVAALASWFSRPPFAAIETRLEQAIREAQEPAGPDSNGAGQGATGQNGLDENGQDQTGPNGGPSGLMAAADANGPRDLTCVLDPQRSRVTTAPEQDLALRWSASGCANGRTQYGLAGDEWVRVTVPASEAAVSVNRFDPAAGEYMVERFLLDRAGMIAARTSRASFAAPQCNADRAAARTLAENQQAIIAALPARPNERLVYRCSPAAPMGPTRSEED